MYDDISEDTHQYFDELNEREAIEEQRQQAIEENEERYYQWRENWYNQFGSWPDEWMEMERYEADVAAGYIS
jgi:hypothetical protein